MVDFGPSGLFKNKLINPSLNTSIKPFQILVILTMAIGCPLQVGSLVSFELKAIRNLSIKSSTPFEIFSHFIKIINNKLNSINRMV